MWCQGSFALLVFLFCWLLWKWTFFVCPIDIPPICKRGTHPCPNAYSAHNWTRGSNCKKGEKTNSDIRVETKSLNVITLALGFVHLLIRCVAALREEIKWARRHLEAAPLISNFFALNNFWSRQLSSSWRPSCFLPLEGEALTKQLHEAAERNTKQQKGTNMRNLGHCPYLPNSII